MVLRLDPRLPVVWRSPTSVQVGVDPAVAVVEDLGGGGERLLAALVGGISESGYAMLARTAKVSPDEAAALLATLRPAFVGAEEPPGSPVAVLGEGALARAIAGLLEAEGRLGPEHGAGLVVLVADEVLAPAEHGRFLNRDVPHLPVVVTDQGVVVGPFVDPGSGPCLYCVQLTRTDEDAAWPAIATQLLGRPPRDPGRLAVAEAAAFTVRRILERRGPAEGPALSWRLAADGGLSARGWARHPGCSCAALPGTGSADAPDRAARAAPSSAPAAAAPA